MKHTLNLPTYDSVLSHMLSAKVDEYNTASIQAVMENSVPIILTGLPGSGKTYFVKNVLIPKLPENTSLLLIDVHNEYNKTNLQPLGLGAFFSLDFKHNIGRFRIIPSKNVDVSKSEIDTLFRHLIMVQHSLKHWVIVLEEAHRFESSSFVRSFIAEGRKHTQKIIAVTPQIGQFKGLGKIVKPIKK